jgi:hypothetical protein
MNSWKFALNWSWLKKLKFGGSQTLGTSKHRQVELISDLTFEAAISLVKRETSPVVGLLRATSLQAIFKLPLYSIFIGTNFELEVSFELSN